MKANVARFTLALLIAVAAAMSPAAESIPGALPEAQPKDACCFVECSAQWSACKQACSGDLACRSLCFQEYETCKNQC